MIKLLVYLLIIGALVYAGTTVKLGRRTFFGHIQAIWATEQVQELKQGVEEKAAPAVERVKRGVKAGIDEADKDVVVDAGVDAAPLEETPPPPPKKKKKVKQPEAEAR